MQVAQLQKAAAEAAQSVRQAEAAEEKALTEAARRDRAVQKLRARLDIAMRCAQSHDQQQSHILINHVGRGLQTTGEEHDFDSGQLK